MLCDTTSSSWSLKIVGAFLEAPSFPPLSHLKWFIYGKSRVIQGNLYKKIQGHLRKTKNIQGNLGRLAAKTPSNHGVMLATRWYIGHLKIPPIRKEASSSKPPTFQSPCEKVFGPQKPIQKTSKGLGRLEGTSIFGGSSLRFSGGAFNKKPQGSARERSFPVSPHRKPGVPATMLPR